MSKVVTARLFFFIGLALVTAVLIAVAVLQFGYHNLVRHDTIVGLGLLGALGIVGMIAGGVEISEIVQNGNNPDSDFH